MQTAVCVTNNDDVQQPDHLCGELLRKTLRIACAYDCDLGETAHGTTALVARRYLLPCFRAKILDVPGASHKAVCASTATVAVTSGFARTHAHTYQSHLSSPLLFPIKVAGMAVSRLDLSAPDGVGELAADRLSTCDLIGAQTAAILPHRP